MRAQIRLTEHQAARLKQLAATQGKSLSGLIRDAVDRFIADDARDARRRRALTVMGRYGTEDAGNASVEHDRHLEEAFGLEPSRSTTTS
ncbi:MAG: ribbon-helix-helix protein, CopG family [Solirubrobacteraceae bacterium]